MQNATPQKPAIRTALVVPCYNEEKRLDVKVFREFVAQPSGAALLFVDDGSRDHTMQVLERVRSGLESRVEILRCESNRGKAEAVRRGMNQLLEQGSWTYIGFWDADLATPLDAVEEFIRILESRPDIEMVFGSRVKLLGRDIQRRVTRHYLGRVFATVVSNILRMPIYDTQCGAKLFRVGPDLVTAVRDPFLSKWVFDVEIIARYLRSYRSRGQRLDDRVYEFPLLRWADIAGSKVKPGDFLLAFKDTFKIWRKYLS